VLKQESNAGGPQVKAAANDDVGAGEGKEAPLAADEAGNRIVVRVVDASTTMS